ncbi:MAG: sulfite exporter TauE/SafE family protein [Candidatus Enterenecus sp.]
MVILFFVVSFLASIVGAICGIGGGVIIKPVLDLLQMGSVSTINFLSGCTVLSMSLYSVGKSFVNRDSKVDVATGTPMAIGAAVGGVVGKQLFSLIRGLFADPNTAGGVQAVCLGIITVGTLAYTLCKYRIHTHKLTGKAVCLVIGLLLGIMSSFLGIGGGPINLVVLYYLFSMDTKTAAANSLYIILFSQLASLITTLVTHSVPEFQWPALILMVAGGIGGGIVGRALNKKLDNRAVDKLFIALMAVIIAICVLNAVRAFL